MKELIFLLTILFIVSNADLIKNTFMNFKQNHLINKVKENFTNSSNQIFKLPNYKFYINSYDEIRNSNMLNIYFSELIDVETINMFKSIHLLDYIKNKSLVFSVISNNKPIASICVVQVKEIQDFLDKNGIVETYLSPINNGYCVFHYLIHKNYIHLDVKMKLYEVLLLEIEKWAKNPSNYDIYQTSNVNFGNNNVYIINKEIYKKQPKAYYLLIFGPKFPYSLVNGVDKTHYNIANLVYENQFSLDWAKKSKLNKIFGINPIPTNNIYLCEQKKKNIENYHRPNYMDTFEYQRDQYLKNNEYNETAFIFMNDWTFYIKYMPSDIQLFKSEQVVNVTNEPYNY